MKIKRISAFLLSLAMIFSLAACSNDDETAAPETTTAGDVSEEFTDTVADETQPSSSASASVPEASAQAENEEASTSAATTTTKVSDNPADWSTAQIVDAYKKAAIKSNSTAKSEQSIELKKISVNNGEHEKVMDFITPIMAKLLASNSKETDGITGGYKNLSASDVAYAKAYKNGSGTAIEMTMHKQTSGAKDDALSGSVGHAITAVGDITEVTKQLKDLGLPLELSEKDTKIYYTNPTLKVLIGPDGKIVKGTWQYTVDIRINNYKAFGKDVETTSVVMLNTITVNGGF
ncbi:MAG: hypothetical protein IJZ57_06435 [Clostridia bacterium]|nr:hypothetical protein [Clostridia bacterium]